MQQVENSNRTPLVSVLLEGTVGCGKTALASNLAVTSGFPYVKLISPEQMVGACLFFFGLGSFGTTLRLCAPVPSSCEGRERERDFNST